MTRRFYNEYPPMKRDADKFRNRPNTEVLYSPRNICRCGNRRAGFAVVDTLYGEILYELYLCSACQYDTSDKLF